MRIALPIVIVAVAYLAWLQGIGQRVALAGFVIPSPARQIAYNMRLFHQAALSLKTANPGASGVLAVVPPSFLTDNRFISCAGNKAVVTYGAGLNSAQSRDVSGELLRQSVMPPELGASNFSPGLKPVGYASGIGLSDGTLVNNGFASLTPACAVPAGAAAIQTQLLP